MTSLFLLLALLASGFSSAQASGIRQEITPTESAMPTGVVTETATTTPGVEMTATPGVEITDIPTIEATPTPGGEPESTPEDSLDDPAAIALSEWPQVQRDAQHSGYYPSTLGTNYDYPDWRHSFQPEKVYPQVQAIVSGGKVFVGTEMGNLYALNATTGADVWNFAAGGPILNSVAVDGGRVFFGAMDGAVYAVDAGSGSLVWKTQLSQFLGFSTAPVIADGKVMLGGRNGIFYALNPSDGSTLWSYDTGSAILQTAAWNGGKAYFGAMNMRVYAINTADGSLAWVSPRIQGMAFKDYWPVVYNGMVYVRPMGYGYVGFQSVDYAKVLNASAQQQLLAQYDANPAAYNATMFRLYESNGQLAPMVIHYNGQTMNGASAPPCVDGSGYLIVPAWLPLRDYFSGWARLNPSSRILVEALVDTSDSSKGGGNPDENLAVTCSQNQIISMHIEEENANFTGFFNLTTRRWTRIYAGAQNRQMANNTQGGGANPASIASGWVYHITYYELVARNTN